MDDGTVFMAMVFLGVDLGLRVGFGFGQMLDPIFNYRGFAEGVSLSIILGFSHVMSG